MRAINDFLSLELVCPCVLIGLIAQHSNVILPCPDKMLPLSFTSAKELRSHAEMLPSDHPGNSTIVPTTHPTKNPVHLYSRDSLECVKALFNHPLFPREMDLSPYHLFTTTE
ncbi:hypothetical protein JVT61DRAFT_12138 [Boletus reticuloceps]|uniref:Uncharacterized protein n=1 Tax=Boletus reticuloceps TaxID=495285 RepID=A0A8I3A4G8_9AGAM|nr:hypothetical protein JVT61DRAFT_12138 [Boletus reticuloceps]